VLTSADLASQERLEELERAKQASLQQTVRGKDESAAIRLGRDGFEKVEDVHEKELRLLAAQEEAARMRERQRAEEAARRDSIEAERKVSEPQNVTPVHVKTPIIPSVESPSKPVITSAWGQELKEEEVSYDQDQTLDLSDIVAEPEEQEAELEPEPAPEPEPPVWTGAVSNRLNSLTEDRQPGQPLAAHPANGREDRLDRHALGSVVDPPPSQQPYSVWTCPYQDLAQIYRRQPAQHLARGVCGVL
jgi:hypothetical protein